MTISFEANTIEELASEIVDRGLIGVNIHYRPETKTWCVWTRYKGMDGWSISGQHPDLGAALLGHKTKPLEPPKNWDDLI